MGISHLRSGSNPVRSGTHGVGTRFERNVHSAFISLFFKMFFNALLTFLLHQFFFLTEFFFYCSRALRLMNLEKLSVFLFMAKVVRRFYSQADRRLRQYLFPGS